MTPHKHEVLIKAWADGAEIQFKNCYNDWETIKTPQWNPNAHYRIKPEEKPEPKFKLGDYVCKHYGSAWKGHIVGTYSTKLTPEGYAVESSSHPGSVQIYPATVLIGVSE